MSISTGLINPILTSMGWQYIEGSWDDPQVTDRENFKQVLISDRLHPILDTQIAALVNRVGASPRSVQVRELGYRWGSCGHKGDLYFHAPCGDAAANHD